MKYTRTAMTLRHTTDFVSEFIFNDIKFTIRALPKRPTRKHYIVYHTDHLTEDVKDWNDIIVLCEINNFKNRFYHGIDIKKQYPEYEENAQEMYKQIKILLTEFEKSTNISHVDSKI